MTRPDSMCAKPSHAIRRRVSGEEPFVATLRGEPKRAFAFQRAEAAGPGHRPRCRHPRIQTLRLCRLVPVACDLSNEAPWLRSQSGSPQTGSRSGAAPDIVQLKMKEVGFGAALRAARSHLRQGDRVIALHRRRWRGRDGKEGPQSEQLWLVRGGRVLRRNGASETTTRGWPRPKRHQCDLLTWAARLSTPCRLPPPLRRMFRAHRQRFGRALARKARAGGRPRRSRILK